MGGVDGFRFLHSKPPPAEFATSKACIEKNVKGKYIALTKDALLFF
jgi:hypothetical protein